MVAEPVPSPSPLPARALGRTRALADALSGAFVGGRLSADRHGGGTVGYTPALVLSPPDAEGQWRAFDLDLASLDRVPPARIMELLADLAPDFSRAVWDFLRFCNPGHDYAIVNDAGDEVADARAKAATDAFLARLRDLHGSLDVVINRVFMNQIMRGAILGELVFDQAGRIPLDLAVPDAASARFRKVNDPERGTIYQLGQMQGGRFVPLDRATIRYVPVDPFPGSPYGRAPLAAAIFPALFRLGLLRDVRRVVAQQGWPRLDIAIDAAGLREQMHDEAQQRGEVLDEDAYLDRLDTLIARVAEGFAALPPDGTYVHTADVTVNRPVGAVDSSALGAVDGLMKAIERSAVQALKTMGFLLSLGESATETQAIRQMEAFMQTIRTFQHSAETVISDWLTLALRAQGIPGKVKFRFAENRASEELRDVQVAQSRANLAAFKYDRGWIDNDDAAKEGADREKADAPEPRQSSSAPEVNPGSLDGQSNRGVPPVRAVHANGQRAKFTPSGAADALPELPESVDLTDDDLRGVLGIWDDEAFAKTKYAGLLDAEVVSE
ncbi:MAG TPA: hypothetical protein VIL85_02910 [Thermomicrobiales bacterium]